MSNETEKYCFERFERADSAISDLWNLGCRGLKLQDSESHARYLAALTSDSDLSITAEFQLSSTGVTEISFFIINGSKREKVFSFFSKPQEELEVTESERLH